MRSRALRLLVASSAFAAFLLALLLAVSPQWHERVHRDAANQQHECAVALVAAGKYHHTPAPDLGVLPVVAFTPGPLPALRSVWVPTVFLDTSPLEHAPPVCS